MAGTMAPAPQAPKDAPMDSSAIRIRDNQRRSRARRKEYLEEVQKKLQLYERQGVQATLDMQQAARDVAIENDRLKMLLQQRGVTADEINHFLQSFPPNPEPEKKLKVQLNPSPSPPRPGHMRPKMALPPMSMTVTTPPSERIPQLPTLAATDSVASTRSSAAHYASAIRTPPEYAPPQPSAPSYMDVVLPPIQSLAPVDEMGVDKLAVLAHASSRQGCCGGQTQCTHSHEVAQAPSPAATISSSAQQQSTSPSRTNASSPMEMSCSQAARIIADMQGYSDYKMAKAALGCNGRGECVVKNSTIFQILETQDPV